MQIDRSRGLEAGGAGHLPAPSGLLFDAEAGELLVELRDLTAGIHHALHAGPSRVRLRIDIQAQRVAFLAHAGSRLELRPIGHYDVDLVVFGVNARLHGLVPCWRRRSRPAAQAGAYS